MRKNGFSLAEVLVVIAIIATMGVIITEIFSRSLRGGNKSQIIASIKQNGQSVLETIDKRVRNSDTVLCPANPGEGSSISNTMAVVKEGVYTRYRFKDVASNQNDYIVSDNPVIPPGLTEEEFLVSLCDNNWDGGITQEIITDTNARNGVSVSQSSLPGGIFKRDKKTGFKDNITIDFKLGPGVSAPSAIAGEVDPVIFTTTIELR